MHIKHYLKKSLSQNFLIDSNIIKKIISITNLKNKNIAEIGVGTGFLTKEYINISKKAVLLEKDKRFF